MHTQLSLQGISGLIEGVLDNPAHMLGPHRVEVGGRKALSVRAYLPESEQAWLVDSEHGSPRPMRRGSCADRR